MLWLSLAACSRLLGLESRVERRNATPFLLSAGCAYCFCLVEEAENCLQTAAAFALYFTPVADSVALAPLPPVDASFTCCDYFSDSRLFCLDSGCLPALLHDGELFSVNV